ncbi:DUF3891 family protein [Psychrobacillus sp. FSL K6-1464]|uniref:DUF3891 family protein n=1 Tax=Psychrobacillus sp. FSL K6-1464 TaxID=2921545 RepID=UPI0030F50FC5
MIVFEREKSYVMVTQDDHAQVSKQIAEHCKDDFYYDSKDVQEVVLAIQEHDRGWIDPDKSPVWNDQLEQPFSFIDYPTDLKISFYGKGLDEVEEMSKYACLLCSLHYSSFVQDADETAVQRFWDIEKQRQDRLYDELGIVGNEKKKETLMYHLDLLKFSDFLSLFICLHEPGDNDKLHPFFKNGFPQLFLFVTQEPIIASWESDEVVTLSFSPLKSELNVKLTYKEVWKEQIEKDGLLQAFKDTPVAHRKVTFK